MPPPDGEGRPVQQRKKLWALAAILLPFVPFADADFHQPQSVEQHNPPTHTTIASPSIVADHAVDRDRDRHRDKDRANKQSYFERDRDNRNLATTALPYYDSELVEPIQNSATSLHNLVKTPEVQRRKSTYADHVQPRQNLDQYQNIVSHDASAISATAPDLSVVAPPSRRLEDWEVEDFLLLATINGDLYATDRKSGKERWHIYLDQPMVETKHHRANKSALDADFTPLDQTIWAVEPTRDGQIYMWAPGVGKGLVHTGLSMKKLVDDFGPYKNDALIYTGDKKTTLLTLDAATGRAIQWHGSTASAVEDNICVRPQEAVAGGDAEECSSASITLGRTEYTVGISSTRGFPIATLKYSEWTPNVFDQDLLRQYQTTMDDVYFTSHPDGRVFAYEHMNTSGRPGDRPRSSFSQHLPSPIAKAFDVMRPVRSQHDSGDNDAHLIALPQPAPPSGAEQQESGRDSMIYINQTEGNWYAMSGRAYPLIAEAPMALINQVPLHALEELPFTPAELERALVGQHTLVETWSRPGRGSFPSLPGSANNVAEPMEQPDLSNNPTLAIDAPDPSSTVINIVKNLPQDALNYTVDLVKNPLIFLILFILAAYNRKTLIRNIRKTARESITCLKTILKQRGFDIPIDMEDDMSDATPDAQGPEVETGTEDNVPPPVAAANVANSEGPESRNESAQAADIDQQANPAVAEEGAEPEKKKKKAHRGRRGGKGQKKKTNTLDDLSASAGDGPGTSVDDAVDIAKNIGERGTKGVEPDLRTLPGHVDEVSNPEFLIEDNLKVNEDQQLGMGSNGTVVYAGEWQNRPVAVKRMLRDFYDIASQETKLLREVDRHQNVIQYFAQLERGNFIYIALELCEASLADVMEKPSQFRQLAEAGGKDPLAVLRQITMGLDHLHALQIGEQHHPWNHAEFD